MMSTETCKHSKVTTYSRMICVATLYEPAEYAWKIVCDECCERLDEVPDGAEERTADWENDYCD